MRGVERPGNNARSIYRYIHAEHKGRMGYCEHLPSDGDLCLCVEHAGDCFDNYVKLWVDDDGLYSVLFEFGAYCFGEVVCTLSDRVFHLLLAGEPIALELEIIRGGK